MTLKIIDLEELKKVAKRYGLRPSKVKGEEVVNIRKTASDRHEDISWEEFDKVLKKRGLAVYKDDKSDFIKIMKVK
jgi:hypothetical protein